MLESPHTPDGLRRSVADDLLSISSDTSASDPLDPDNVREWFPIALGRLNEKGDPNEAVHLNSSGGQLPPIPMSEALRDALQADAARCRREPHAQVAAILDSYYGIEKSELRGKKRGNKDESQG